MKHLTRYLLPYIYKNGRKYSKHIPNYKFEKVLLLHKLSRLDVERYRQPDLTESELEETLRKAGSDYEAMKRHHDVNKEFQIKVNKAFQDMGIETNAVNRFNYTESNIEWCDAVIPVGGDGTFLLAASRILNNVKPVIGLNSDPCRSEGYLCLPKQFSANIHGLVEKLLKGEFEWMFRSRIRVTLFGDDIHGIPVELHEQALGSKMKDMVADERRKQAATSMAHESARVLPVLALNEVFLGETLSAKVSYFEVKLNGSPDSTRVRSSGLCVCTGTGSTSWHFSMNRFSEDDIKVLLKLYSYATETRIDESVFAAVCDRFNSRFIFSPEEEKLGYTIRDLVYGRVWPKPKGRLPARGFAGRMEIKSRCSDAGLVIDGGIHFNFNDGTIAVLETRPEDSLRTIRLKDS